MKPEPQNLRVCRTSLFAHEIAVFVNCSRCQPASSSRWSVIVPGGRPSTIRYGWSVSKLCSVTVVMATQALRVIKVPVDAVDVLGRYHSPKFQAAGHAWQLRVDLRPDLTSTPPGKQGVYLIACGDSSEGSSWKREEITFKVCILHIKNNAKKMMTLKSAQHCFTSKTTTHGWSTPKVPQLEKVPVPSEGFMDEDQYIHFVVDITAPKALQPKDAALASDLTAAPEDSESGDTLIKLDDSTTLRAHALHLKKASSVFQFALQACDMPAPEGRKRKAPHDGDGVLYRLPLPCVNARQAMLLLHYLYSDVPESWTAALEISDLVRLAEVANQCACLSLLKLVDSTMVKHSTAQEAHHTTSAGPAILTAKTAPEQLSLAGKLNLEVYQAHVGCYIGRHASEIDLSLLEPSLKHALGGALEAQAKLLASMSS